MIRKRDGDRTVSVPCPYPRRAEGWGLICRVLPTNAVQSSYRISDRRSVSGREPASSTVSVKKGPRPVARRSLWTRFGSAATHQPLAAGAFGCMAKRCIALRGVRGALILVVLFVCVQRNGTHSGHRTRRLRPSGRKREGRVSIFRVCSN